MKSFQKILLIKILVILLVSLIVLNISQHHQILKLKNNNNNVAENNNQQRDLKVYIQNENEIIISDESVSEVKESSEQITEEEKESTLHINTNIDQHHKQVNMNTDTNSDNEINIPSVGSEDIVVDFDYNVEFVKGDKPKYRWCGGCAKCNHSKKQSHLIVY